jgi:hypothetical protein
VLALLPQVGDPGGIELGETVAQILELATADLDVPGSFDRSPALLKLDAVGLRKMSPGVALHVDGTELHIGLGEKALTDGQQAGEIVLNEDHDATQTALNQTAKNRFPVFEILPARPGDTAEHGIFCRRGLIR